ncbi:MULTISPECIES: hypothetical protein [Pseudomonas]|uniref:hypothetical protein n=1 Tax=Pseudomonas TaxID=286 RepID=UPI0011AFA925|nr:MULTISPECIES: hypothetical protein [Pseudomonas]QIA01042.1 hypothetical protein GZH78_02580 [Pseudomonas fluorescens]
MSSTIVNDIPEGLSDDEFRNMVSKEPGVRIIGVARGTDRSQATITWEYQESRKLTPQNTPQGIFVGSKQEVDFQSLKEALRLLS